MKKRWRDRTESFPTGEIWRNKKRGWRKNGWWYVMMGSLSLSHTHTHTNLFLFVPHSLFLTYSITHSLSLTHTHTHTALRIIKVARGFYKGGKDGGEIWSRLFCWHHHFSLSSKFDDILIEVDVIEIVSIVLGRFIREIQL